MSRQYFGTDGIRGTVGQAPITPDFVLRLGHAVGQVLRRTETRPTVLIGKDTRISGYMLESALEAGFASAGVDVLLTGPLPTPGVAYLTRALRQSLGVVISASHNPFQDNGIKIFSADGFKLPDEVEADIEDLIFSQKMAALRPVAEEVGRASRIDDAAGRYIVALKNTFPKDYVLDDFHIVLDCAHGATYKVAPHVFAELGARVTCIGCEPDGTNINASCGALHPEVMAARVQQLGADIGLALDGDGDRLIVCDEHGAIVDGDHIMAICASELMHRRKLKKKTLVATVMSNMGLEQAMVAMGGQMVRTQVGDRYVVEAMRARGYNFGGEQSGHLVFLDYNTTGDGTLAALQLLAIMIRKRKPLSELAAIMTTFPQILENVRMAVRIAPEQIPGFPEALRACEQRLGSRGRILVRPSGTEPVIRVMTEGEDEAEIAAMAHELCDVIRRADRI